MKPLTDPRAGPLLSVGAAMWAVTDDKERLMAKIEARPLSVAELTLVAGGLNPQPLPPRAPPPLRD